MGCYIGLTHTITHHLHLTGAEAKTEMVGAYLQIAYMCMCVRENSANRDKKIQG